MTKSNTPRIPTHEVFHVVGEKDKTRWTKIGVAWQNRDGDGMNLVINYQPLVEGRTVVRKIQSRKEVA